MQMQSEKKKKKEKKNKDERETWGHATDFAKAANNAAAFCGEQESRSSFCFYPRRDQNGLYIPTNIKPQTEQNNMAPLQKCYDPR